MKINAQATMVAIAAAMITADGAFANDVEFVPGKGAGQGGQISFYRNAVRPRNTTVALYPYVCRVAFPTAGNRQKAQLRCETISIPQGGQVTFYRPVE